MRAGDSVPKCRCVWPTNSHCGFQVAFLQLLQIFLLFLFETHVQEGISDCLPSLYNTPEHPHTIPVSAHTYYLLSHTHKKVSWFFQSRDMVFCFKNYFLHMFLIPNYWGLGINSKQTKLFCSPTSIAYLGTWIETITQLNLNFLICEIRIIVGGLS